MGKREIVVKYAVGCLPPISFWRAQITKLCHSFLFFFLCMDTQCRHADEKNQGGWFHSRYSTLVGTMAKKFNKKKRRSSPESPSGNSNRKAPRMTEKFQKPSEDD